MRVPVTLLSLVLAVAAYDSVIFSNEVDVTDVSVSSLLSSASTSSPVVVIVNPDFTLGQFSRKVNAYSEETVTDYLALAVKDSKYHASKFFSSQLEISAKAITSIDDFVEGQSVYVVAGEEWTSAEILAQKVFAKLGDSVVGVLTATDAIASTSTRVKRVATSAFDETAGGAPTSFASFPLIIPPYNISDFGAPTTAENDTCLFYLEGLTIVVQQTTGSSNQYLAIPIRLKNATWGVSDGDWSCTKDVVGPYKFRVYLKANGAIVGQKDGDSATIPDGSIIDLSLTFSGKVNGYWALSEATLNAITITGAGNIKSASVTSATTINSTALQYANVGGVIGFAYACHDTQAFFFPSSESTVKIGVALYNAEIQTIALLDKTSQENWKKHAFFTRQVVDCVGTFSTGSWMGLISALIMISALLFGYVMLQSVQTQDKFDDPKQKQIVINVRE